MDNQESIRRIFSSNLQRLFDEKGLQKNALADFVGVSDNTVTNWTHGHKMPRMDKIDLICRFFGVKRSALLEMPVTLRADTERTITDDLPRELFPIRDTHRVPIIGSVRCGPGGPAFEYVDEYIAIDDSYKPDEIRGFRAEGDSMEGDEIHDGDLCLVRLQDEVEDGALAVVVIDGEEGTLKHVHRSPGVIVLESSNPKYPPRIITGEAANTVRVIGKIVEVRHRK